MKRNSRTFLLTLLVVGLSGCTHSDQSTSAGTFKPHRNGDDRRNSNLPLEEPPKILPRTYFAAGQLLERQGEYEAALQQYRKALLVSHDYVAAQHRLGLLLSTLGRRDEALAALRRAVDLKPDNPILHNNLGYELMLHERWDEAEREFARAIDLDEEFTRPYVNRGLALAKLQRYDEAFASFRQVLPEADARYNMGLMYRADRRYEQAAGAFNQVLSVNPQFTAASSQLEQLAPRLEELRGVEAVARAAEDVPYPALIAVDESQSVARQWDAPVQTPQPVRVRSYESGESVVHTESARSASATSTWVEPSTTHSGRPMERSATSSTYEPEQPSSTWIEPTPTPSGRPMRHSSSSSDYEFREPTSSASPIGSYDVQSEPTWSQEMSDQETSSPMLPTPIDVTRFELAYQPEYAGPLSKQELMANLSVIRNEIYCHESRFSEFGYSLATDADVDWVGVMSSSAIAPEFTSSAFPAIESTADWTPSTASTWTFTQKPRTSPKTMGMTVLEESSQDEERESLYDLGPWSRPQSESNRSEEDSQDPAPQGKPDPSNQSSRIVPDDDMWVIPADESTFTAVAVEPSRVVLATYLDGETDFESNEIVMDAAGTNDLSYNPCEMSWAGYAWPLVLVALDSEDDSVVGPFSIDDADLMATDDSNVLWTSSEPRVELARRPDLGPLPN